MTTITADASLRESRARAFYAWMAAACVATAFLGFIPTYWQPMAAGKFAANPIVHLHGFVMFSWTLFALVQTSLVPARRVALHREVGLFGISFATVIVMVALLASLNSERNSAAVPGGAGPAEAFLIVPLEVIASFAVLFTLAVANIKRPEFHKRYMLLATIALLNAPVARPILTWVFTEQQPGGTPPVWINVPACWTSYLLILPPMFFDWRTRGRVHPVYSVALPALMFAAWVVIPISETNWWHAFARFYMTLAGTVGISHA